MDKCREQFEEWAARYHGALNMGVVGVVYSNQAVQHDWFLWQQAWQASRQALVVELKQSSRVGDSDYGRGLVDGSAIYKIYVEGQLDNAGIKWKE